MAQLPTAAQWAQRCANDGEFALAARYWNGGLRLRVGDAKLEFSIASGQVSSAAPNSEQGVIEFAADAGFWDKMLAATPPRFHNDTFAALNAGSGLKRGGDPLVHAQYYGAAMRAIELLRPSSTSTPALRENPAPGQLDMPVGRYVHLELGGHDHRIYFEEAGTGIPLLLQHTAGCHSSQWRHLFEVPEILENYRLIAYDLPYHGKSLPPVTKEWWAEGYDLQGDFLRSVPLALASALDLDNPVFMGCSVGGLLALDLAHRHPDIFRSVISVEGTLKIEGNLSELGELWHPQVGNEYKARAMEGLTAPNSPKPYVKETSFVYSAGWPAAFLGDLYYYIEDFDLRNVAANINTEHVGVHILSGEYDYSGTVELGREAHETIKGSTFAEMKGVGHFPMSENPTEFLRYLMPVLNAIRQT